MHEQATLSPLPLSARLPVTRSLTLYYPLTLAVSLLLALASVAGLLYGDALYPTAELRHSFVTNDIVNLVIGLPILLGSLWLARRGRLLGLLFWPGALFYVFYNAFAYTVALPVNAAFVLNLVLVAASAYTLIALVTAIDAQAVRRRLAGVVPERTAGGALVGLGILFILFVAVALADALINGTPVSAGDRALHVADLLIAPSLATGGFLLWRREALGYVAGIGLLFQATMLFVGLIGLLLLQPLLFPIPFQIGDLIAVAVMSLFCFVPFILFIRGVWLQEA